ncbi:poly-gamma-glutamate synthase PgsB [Candidatus Contubernalis alkaliaceticus]|uniref:poly-gamma-glutamate synthase PgsB n=1 Tax=Candidatus Contubernalis alkaliaceticus TaxID=338645 RepID=UPI001F4C0771|nr:poly-gamma-glutamate synthase PgsB [Candidatus Contubernalis alkalaceticus]UNC91712.1 poly-gamma-glutamate synthase PgsB [Candidatus Contubernalis alkalaceticus]
MWLHLLPGTAILGLGAALAVKEKQVINKQLAGIKHRIIVNGTRGKSTVTRLLTSTLLEQGLVTMGKTTGSEARILSCRQQENGSLCLVEEEQKRPPEGANIKEIRSFLRKANRNKTEAIVVECMAIEPQYQRVLSNDFLKVNTAIIVNVLEDHLETLGPTLQEAAEDFACCIPQNGLLVTSPGKHLPYFKETADQKGTKTIIADVKCLPSGYWEEFPYPVFPETLAISLAAALALGVDRDKAFQGMLKAGPDPGNLLLEEIKDVKNQNNGSKGLLVKAFAANDPSSALNIWEHFQEKGLLDEDTVILMNCRRDRVERSENFALHVLPKMKGKSLLVMGELTKPVVSRYKNLPFEEILDLEGLKAKDIAAMIRNKYSGNVFFGTGNYCGVARELCRELMRGEGICTVVN